MVVGRGEADGLLEVLVESGRAAPELLEDLAQLRAVQLLLQPPTHVGAGRVGVAGVGPAEVKEIYL